MKLHFFGTGAPEGVPAVFCECEYCKKIRTLGGKNIRLRTSVQLDDHILIDFSSDGYAQSLFRGMDTTKITHVLITHSHEDHFYPVDLLRAAPPFGLNRTKKLHICGNSTVTDKLNQSVSGILSLENVEKYLAFHTLSAYETYKLGDYKVTPLPASHDPRECCYIYIIEHNGKTLLYGHDSAFFSEAVWKFLGDFRFDCVVLDCTMVDHTGIFEGHMGLPDNILVRKRMLDNNIAAEQTRFILTHFDHCFNPLHERITPLFQEEGFIAAYDGMELSF